jgi:hypothetical protein
MSIWGGFGRPICLIHSVRKYPVNTQLLCAQPVAICQAFRLKARLHQKGTSYLMAKKAVKRREWSPADVKTLRSLARKKTHAGRIAKALRRTEGATRQKAFSLGLSLDAR